jgi:dTDP-4-amino-4,6-dideoxygalactose transaminase
VLVDSEPDTWNMDPELLEEAIRGLRSKGLKSKGQEQPKAIIVAHLYGMPAKMNEIMDVADRYGIPVVEDAAEALGSEYMGRRVGCNSKFGILSFNGNKIITTSGGGALISDEAVLIERARFLATQARDPAPHYQHSTIGYNYRMSNVVAGVGRGQLEVLDLRVRQHREFNAWYRELLKDVPGVTFQSEPSADFHSNFWLTCIVIDPAVSGTDREKLRLAFESANIESRPLWKPMHLQPVFAGCPAYVNGTSEKLFENGLCLPSGSNIDDDGRRRIAEVLKREFRL